MSSLTQEQRNKVNNFLRSLNQRITNFVEEMVTEGEGGNASANSPQQQAAELDQLLSDLQQDFQNAPAQAPARDNSRSRDRRRDNRPDKKKNRPERKPDPQSAAPVVSPAPVEVSPAPSVQTWEDRPVSEPHLQPISHDIGVEGLPASQPQPVAVDPILPQPTIPVEEVPADFGQAINDLSQPVPPPAETSAPDLQFANDLLNRVEQKTN